MSRTPKKSIASPASNASAPNAPTVDIVGGGLAGLTAALRLASCGFKVTLHEATGCLGGNLSSECVNGVWHDVYPHMFCDWYSNFWTIFAQDLGLSRTDHFEPRMGVKLLNAGATKFIELENATTFKAMLANMGSGLASWPDLFLFGFSMLDLAATPFDRSRSDQLEKLDVNGFIYSRGYSTERVAQLQNYILMLIWSIQSDLTAASSYQDFIKHTIAYPKPTPFAWLLKGSLQEKIIAPFTQTLDKLKCEIRLNHEAIKVELNDDKPTITFRDTSRVGAAEPRSRDVSTPDYLVIATPAKALSKLSLSGREGRRIVDRLPRLAELRRLRGEAIPVLDLYFTKKLPDIPKEQFALGGSESDMTVLDLSQLWTGAAYMADQTALALAASNGCALPAMEDAELGQLMIKQLHAYLPIFKLPERWLDPECDIDWEKTNFRTNDSNRLFINEVGSWDMRPEAAYPNALPNVFFAGDFCRTDVDMATIEAAVQSGLKAARALQIRELAVGGEMVGAPVTPGKHQVYSDAHFLAAKLALLPIAYAATAASAYMDAGPVNTEGAMPMNAYSPRTYSVLLPLAFTLDWLKTAYWLGRRLLPGGSPSGEYDDEITVDGGPLAAPLAPVLAAVGETVSLAGQWLQDRAEKIGPTQNAPPAGVAFATALGAFIDQAQRTARAAYPPPSTPNSSDDDDTHRRRWRAKR